MTLNEFIKDRYCIAMIRLVVDGKANDYSNYRIDKDKLYLFDNDHRLLYTLWLSDDIDLVDETDAIVGVKYGSNKTKEIGISLFLGGSI